MKLTTYCYVTVIAAVTALLSFSGVALAAEAIDPSDGPSDLAQTIYNAVSGGHKAYAAALVLVAGVALIRKYFGQKWAWVHTDAGAAGLVLLGAFGTALAASLAGGGPLTEQLAWSAACVAFAAAGGYAMTKKIIVEPVLRPLADKAPKYLRFPLQLLTWWFEHKTDQGNTDPTPSVPTA